MTKELSEETEKPMTMLNELTDEQPLEVSAGAYDFVLFGTHFFSMPSLAGTGSYACSEPAGGGAWSCSYHG